MMMITTTCYSSFLFLIVSSLVVFPSSVASVGINYGQIANNLPNPDEVVPLVLSIGATKVKLYDSDAAVLRAFANTGVEFIVGVRNEDLARMSTDPDNAVSWVKSNVQAYLPATKITCITVGNEILTFNDTTMSNNLLPAMQAVHSALVKLGLDQQVTVTTAHALSVLESSDPPSSGAFRKDLIKYITPILNFHSKTGSSFLINAYPYFAYKASPKQIPIDFVLFQPNQGVLDPGSNLHYDNMLFAQIDAVYSALSSLGYKKLPLQISETGWPSKGDEDEPGASLENAQKYNGNLMKLISQKSGTPMRPTSYLDIYVFALFNENMKPGPTSERNYGLFKPDKSPAYTLRVGVAGNATGYNQNYGTPSTTSGSSSPTDYLTISAARPQERLRSLCIVLLLLMTFWSCCLHRVARNY